MAVSTFRRGAAGGAVAFRLLPTRPSPRLPADFTGFCARMLLVFLLKGVLVGIIIAVPVGPVGVLCIRRTILNGRLAGFVSGLGAATADAVFGIIAGYGLTFIADLLLDYKDWLRLRRRGVSVLIGSKAIVGDPAHRKRAGTRCRDPARRLRFDLRADDHQPDHDPRLFSRYSPAIGFTGQRRDAGGGRRSSCWGSCSARCCGGQALTFGAGRCGSSVRSRSHLVWIDRGSGRILVLSGVALLGSFLFHHFR